MLKDFKRLSFVFIMFSLLSIACDSSRKQEYLNKELLEIDIEFSRKSAEAGGRKVFLEYISDDCVLLRPNRNPVLGRPAIEKMFQHRDTNFTLSWEPLFADVSLSGEMGYTYGIYTIDMYSQEGQPVQKQGTYVNIWKKDKNGRWKFVLDSGNQGLGIPAETTLQN
ncbi:MAG: nuclear transport factor 2 family protein [Bacteroidales bacterium]|nr:nuclear transport factor 2 family protein [Bacteroidales bacterium]